MKRLGSVCFGLLAGGRSSRMGVDKATLLWQGQPLWQHQLRLATEIQADEVLISGHPHGPYRDAARVVPDEIRDCGPLGGVTSLLAAMKSEFLVVVAVDMPFMDVPTLKRLLAESTAGCGTVPILIERVEPLAAVYPRGLLSLAREHASFGDRSMQLLARRALEFALVRAFPLAANQMRCFQSLNTPKAWSEAVALSRQNTSDM